MDFRFYLITDRRLLGAGRRLEDVLEPALMAGVKGVLFREKDMDIREQLGLGGRVRELTRRYGAKMLVSTRVDLALALDADGVHLSGTSLPLWVVRELMHDRLVAVSTHSVEEAVEAEEGGADFITFGPVYHTESKARYGPPVGLAALEKVCREVGLPVFALGGIRNDNVEAALRAGAYGVAAISAVTAAGDPGRAAGAILETIRHYKESLAA